MLGQFEFYHWLHALHMHAPHQTLKFRSCTPNFVIFLPTSGSCARILLIFGMGAWQLIRAHGDASRIGWNLNVGTLHYQNSYHQRGPLHAQNQTKIPRFGTITTTIATLTPIYKKGAHSRLSSETYWNGGKAWLQWSSSRKQVEDLEGSMAIWAVGPLHLDWLHNVRVRLYSRIADGGYSRTIARTTLTVGSIPKTVRHSL